MPATPNQVSSKELAAGLQALDIPPAAPVLAHASLSAFGRVQGGAATVVEALLDAFVTLVMPVFTYKAMLVPEVGPVDNAITYGSAKGANRMADFFRPEMPADRMMGVVAEALRCHPEAQRSTHPILSFAGVNADTILESQTLAQPLAPVGSLAAQGGWVLLLGVDHTCNTSIHYAERLAGRKQFIRWALTPRGVVECPNWPGCSDGFEAIAPRLVGVTHRAQIGQAHIQAVPLVDLVEIVRACIAEDPLALLCERASCQRCQATRIRVVRNAPRTVP
ncbi:MAG: AAC(3) family N-acetyltransferase [Chloroflexota bacterium]